MYQVDISREACQQISELYIVIRKLLGNHRVCILRGIHQHNQVWNITYIDALKKCMKILSFTREQFLKHYNNKFCVFFIFCLRWHTEIYYSYNASLPCQFTALRERERVARIQNAKLTMHETISFCPQQPEQFSCCVRMCVETQELDYEIPRLRV